MNKRNAILAISMALIILGVGTLGVGLVRAGDADDKEKSARVPAVVPQADRAVKNPIPADTRSVDFGKLLFSSQCVMCHGKEAVGNGDLVERLNLTMPDLTDPSVLEGRTDGELFYILSHGHGSMPGQDGRFDEKTRWDLVNYVRTVQIDIR